MTNGNRLEGPQSSSLMTAGAFFGVVVRAVAMRDRPLKIEKPICPASNTPIITAALTRIRPRWDLRLEDSLEIGLGAGTARCCRAGTVQAGTV